MRENPEHTGFYSLIERKCIYFETDLGQHMKISKGYSTLYSVHRLKM